MKNKLLICFDFYNLFFSLSINTFANDSFTFKVTKSGDECFRKWKFNYWPLVQGG